MAEVTDPKTEDERPTGQEILDVPVHEGNDAGATTIRGYLVALLANLWDQGEGFSGKRPFGNSGWDWDLYAALGRAGHIEAWFDEDGWPEGCDEQTGNELIEAAIKALGEKGGSEPDPTTPERLAEIRSKPFSDLTPGEMLTWSTADPGEYYAAAERDARRVVEQEAEAARRRGAARRRERMLSPFRRLACLLGGGRHG